MKCFEEVVGEGLAGVGVVDGVGLVALVDGAFGVLVGACSFEPPCGGLPCSVVGGGGDGVEVVGFGFGLGFFDGVVEGFVLPACLLVTFFHPCVECGAVDAGGFGCGFGVIAVLDEGGDKSGDGWGEFCWSSHALILGDRRRVRVVVFIPRWWAIPFTVHPLSRRVLIRWIRSRLRVRICCWLSRMRVVRWVRMVNSCRS